MRGTAWISALGLALVAAPVVHAQTVLLADADQAVSLPVKGRIAARDGRVDLTFKVYDRAQGGRLIHSETQRVDVRRGIYFAMVGGRAAALRSTPQTWVEVSRSGRPVGERQAFEVDSGGDVGVETHIPGSAAFCFSCGGRWPIFTGAFTTEQGDPTEFGGGCANPLTVRSDTRPFLCTKRSQP